MPGKQFYMKAAVVAILLVFGSSAYAVDLTGTFRGKTTTITIKKLKVNEAWKINCSGGPNWGFHYYALKPEKKTVAGYDTKFVCTPEERLTGNVYSVSVKNNKGRKSECSLIGEFIAPAESYGPLELAGQDALAELNINGDTADFSMSLAQERQGCGYLTNENYKRQK